MGLRIESSFRHARILLFHVEQNGNSRRDIGNKAGFISSKARIDMIYLIDFNRKASVLFHVEQLVQVENQGIFRQKEGACFAWNISSAGVIS